MAINSNVCLHFFTFILMMTGTFNRKVIFWAQVGNRCIYTAANWEATESPTTPSLQIWMFLKKFVSLVCSCTSTVRWSNLGPPYTAIHCDLVESVQRFAGKLWLKSLDIGYPEKLGSLNLPSLESRSTQVDTTSQIYEYPSSLPRGPFNTSRLYIISILLVICSQPLIL